MPVLDPKQCAMSGAEDEALLDIEETIRHPIEGAADMRADVLVGDDAAVMAHDEEGARLGAAAEPEAAASGLGDLV